MKNMVCAPDGDLVPHGSPERRVLEPGLWGQWLHGGYRWGRHGGGGDPRCAFGAFTRWAAPPPPRRLGLMRHRSLLRRAGHRAGAVTGMQPEAGQPGTRWAPRRGVPSPTSVSVGGRGRIDVAAIFSVEWVRRGPVAGGAGRRRVAGGVRPGRTGGGWRGAGRLVASWVLTALA